MMFAQITRMLFGILQNYYFIIYINHPTSQAHILKHFSMYLHYFQKVLIEGTLVFMVLVPYKQDFDIINRKNTLKNSAKHVCGL